jgi:hypothetical protein
MKQKLMSSSFVFFIARPCFGMIFTLLYKKRKKRKREKNYNHPERQVVWLLRKRLSLFFGEKKTRAFFVCLIHISFWRTDIYRKRKKKHFQEKNIYIEKR